MLGKEEQGLAVELVVALAAEKEDGRQVHHCVLSVCRGWGVRGGPLARSAGQTPP